MRARYYNPQIKRFINQDVLTGSINDSPTLNRYAYVQGNPISLTDPFGLSPDLNWAGAGHAALSVLGFIPVLGAFTDLANSIWYLFEGEIAKSLTSLVSALPGLGDLIGAGAKTVQLAKTAAAVKAMGLIGKSAVSGLSIGNTISTNIDRYLNGEKFTLGQVSIDITSIFLNVFAVKLSVNEAKKIEEALGELIALNNAGKLDLSGSGSSININQKPNVSNQKLQNIINDLYKGQGGLNTIGNGTAMDAVRNEILTGSPTNGKFHTQKLNDYLNALNRRLRAGDLNNYDESVVKTLIADIIKALNGQ